MTDNSPLRELHLRLQEEVFGFRQVQKEKPQTAAFSVQADQ